MLSALNVHPCIILETAHSVLEEELLPKVVHTRLSIKKGKRSKECGTKLAEKVVLSDGKEHFSPFKVYCFNSVINQIEAMLKRPTFPEKINVICGVKEKLMMVLW